LVSRYHLASIEQCAKHDAVPQQIANHAEFGNLLDPGAKSTSPQYAFLEALEAAGDKELDGSYDEALKQTGPSWSALLDEDYPLTQNAPKDPTGWGSSESSQAPPAEVEHDYAVYGKKPSKKQVTARENQLIAGNKPKMGNRRMVGLLKMIRNVAFAHRSQHVQFSRFESEESVMRYMIDPFPWLLMTVYKLDQGHQIIALKGGLTTTGSERDTDAVTTDGGSTSMSDAGLTSNDDGESQPEGRKQDTAKTEKVHSLLDPPKVFGKSKGQAKTAAPNKKAARKGSQRCQNDRKPEGCSENTDR
jgi:hypothetical protein